MMFLLHLGLLLYGLLAMLVGKFRTSGEMWDAANRPVYELVDKFFPESIFQPWEQGTADLKPALGRTYLIGGALAAYAARYLFTRHRG